MPQIPTFIAAHMGYLWDGARFRIIGSEVTEANGGDSTLLVESAVLRLRFVTDKTQLFLDIQPTAGRAKDWYSVDLVRRLFLGEREPSAVLDASYADFIGERLDDIEARFDSERWPETQTEPQQLKAVRSKEMFG